MTEEVEPSLIDRTYAEYPHAFMTLAELSEPMQYTPGGRYFPPGITCAACGTQKVSAKDHCHEHGWVRGIVCGSCNRQLGFVDRGIAPRVAGELLAALLAVRNRCPDCEPITVADLAAFRPLSPPSDERREQIVRDGRMRRLAARKAYRLVKQHPHKCPSCRCGSYHFVPLLRVRQKRVFGPFTFEEAEEFLAS